MQIDEIFPSQIPKLHFTDSIAHCQVKNPLITDRKVVMKTQIYFRLRNRLLDVKKVPTCGWSKMVRCKAPENLKRRLQMGVFHQPLNY
jgi:hypothetical protein